MAGTDTVRHGTGEVLTGPVPCHISLTIDFQTTPSEPPMQTFFVEIKCKLGKTYAVANALADREIASEIYSTAGNYDILAKFHVDDGVDIGHFIAENVQVIPEIADTHTIITFKAF
jgi:DNA-binding Lrp family transcriptional regulator